MFKLNIFQLFLYEMCATFYKKKKLLPCSRGHDLLFSISCQLANPLNYIDISEGIITDLSKVVCILFH